MSFLKKLFKKIFKKKEVAGKKRVYITMDRPYTKNLETYFFELLETYSKDITYYIPAGTDSKCLFAFGVQQAKNSEISKFFLELRMAHPNVNLFLDVIDVS